ncbi:MAG TPA: BON domain-containing protein [Caldilineaceae bacterium]|nr:BON domain-containing protein [Caldilineaceae bacterium]
MARKARKNQEQERRRASDAPLEGSGVDDPYNDDAPRVSSGSQWGDPTDAPTDEVSFEELMELQDELEEETSWGDLIDTQHTDGSTDNVHLAMDQGLVYTPPHDPPVAPSDDLQGVEIAAGFASSMEEADLDVEDLPERVDNNDSDLEENIRDALRYNSETMNLDDVRVYVRNGIVYLRGTVETDEDIAIVDELVRDIEGVVDVENELDVDFGDET